VILVRIRTNVVLVAASALGYFYFTGVQTFAVSLWTEGYGVSRTLAPVFTLLVGVALAVGVVIGGPLGDKLLLRGYKSGRVTAVLIAFGGCVIFLVPALATVKLAITLPLLLLAGMTLGSANPPLDATRIDIVPPRLLGRAESLRNAVRDGADAAAPLLFGVLGTAIGLRHTFLVLTGVLVMAGLLGLIAFKTYAGDAAAVARSDPPPPGKAYVTPEPGAG
jgi:MFS family permease